MPKVIIIPYNQIEKVCQDAVTFANHCQNDFDFYILPRPNRGFSILNEDTAEAFDIFEYLEKEKSKHGYEEKDLFIVFYNGILKATSKGLSNLFCAGSRYDETYPCTGVISLQYLGWDILEEKYNYEVQKHSILHLLIQNEEYGKAILRLCNTFKTSNYQNIMQEVTNITVGNITAKDGQIIIGSTDVTIINSPIDKKEIAARLQDLIDLLRKEPNIDEKSQQAVITNIDKVREEIGEETPDRSLVHYRI